MNASHDLVARYIALWNETADARRRALIQETFSGSARYVDPLMESEGHEGIDAMIRAVQARYPDHRFSLAGEVDQHKRFVRFSWNLAAPGGPVLAGGTDFGVLAEDGRLESVTGFLDAVKAGAPTA